MSVADNPPATVEPSSGSRTDRWTPALIVIGIVIAATIFVLVVLAGLVSAPSSIVARWVPADTAAYVEIRLDLPGDQEANLASFLSHFPGFDDTARLPDKLEELGDRLLGAVSGGRLDYRTQIAPWFGGQLGFATRSGQGELDRPRTGLAVATVTDEARAADWVRSILGGGSGSEVYKGVTITVAGGGDAQVAWAVTGGVLLAGDPASVRAAIDTSGSSSFASRSDVSTARKELGGDQLAFLFIDTTAIAVALDDATQNLPVPLPSGAAGQLPAWAAGGLRFEGETAIATTVAPHVEGASVGNAQSAIPARIPASTIVLLDAHDVGPRLSEALGSIGGTGDLGSIDGALRLLGGANGLVGWIAEVGIVVDTTPAGPAGGVVATSSDADASRSLFTQLEVAARLAGASVEQSDYEGTRIVTIELTDLDRLLEGAGIGNLGEGLLPVPVTGSISLSWAVKADLVVVGSSADFVRGVLATTSDSSLASDETFRSLLDEAGRSHAALGWVDVGGAIGLAGHFGSGTAGLLDGSTDAAQYLAPLDAALGTFVVGGSVDRSTLIVSVKEAS
jgi:hypothetical protein